MYLMFLYLFWGKVFYIEENTKNVMRFTINLIKTEEGTIIFKFKEAEITSHGSMSSFSYTASFLV